MAKELYVGSLSFQVTEYDIEKLFSVLGKVTSIHLITDPKTGAFKGCGYVRMSTDAEVKAALDLDGAILLDRHITVSIAKPQKMNPQGGGMRIVPSRPAKASASSSTKPANASKSASATKPASASRPATAAKPHSDSKASGHLKSGTPRPGSSRTKKK